MTDLPTPRLALPMLQPGQAQKEMYHNEALSRLDLAVQTAVLAFGLNIPPGDPATGDAWIVGDTPSGAWTGRDASIAGWSEAGWRFLEPAEGMRAWVSESDEFALFFDGVWHVGEAYGRLIVDGEQVVGARGEAIEDPDGGSVIDLEARGTIGAILAALRTHGLVDPG